MSNLNGLYIISKYVYVYENHDHLALWHSLRMDKVFGKKLLLDIYNFFMEPKEIAAALQFFPEESLEKLISGGFLVSPADDEEQLLAKLRKKAGAIQVKNLVLLVSNDCNFQCSYCQIEENIQTRNMINMPGEVALKALALFKNNSSPSLQKTITLTGGEPLLNKEVIKLIINEVRNSWVNTRIVVFTNGSLVTTEIANFFKENNVLVLVSLDGPKEMHDKVRLNRSKMGTFDAALKGYMMLRDHGCNVGISAVGGNHNINDLEETFDFFTNLNPPSIGFNFSHFLIGKDNPTEIPIEQFGKVLLKFYEKLREKGIFLENISRPITAFTSNVPKVNECQAQGKGITVDARGKVGPCKSLLINDVYAEDIDKIACVAENEMFKEWAKRSPLAVEECVKCPALTLCGGGCAYDSYISYQGNYHQFDERICNYEKNVLDYLIWELFKVIQAKVDDQTIYFPNRMEQEYAFTRYFDERNELQKSVGHEQENEIKS